MNTAVHPVDHPPDCSFYLFKIDKTAIGMFCSILVFIEITEKATSLGQHFWAIATLKPRKLYIICLTYSYPQNVKYPFDITYLPNSCEAGSESLLLQSNDQLTSEVTSRFKFLWEI